MCHKSPNHSRNRLTLWGRSPQSPERKDVFDRYIENADKVMDLSYAMLEKHIADQEELPDNTDVIRRKQGEIEKLMNKRTNLIEMRAEGDIDKEMFRSKKQEIEDRVAKLTEEINCLS